MDALKAYIASDGGISLKATNGKYLSRIYYVHGGRHAIEAAKEVKDPFTRFTALVVDDKLVLKGDNGRYLSRIYRDAHYLEAEKEKIDICCQFRVHSVGPGLIALQGDNGCYVSMVQRGNVSSIEVSKKEIDDECKFMVGIGKLPIFEIVSIAWDNSATLLVYQPSVVITDTYNNGGSNPIQLDFPLLWEEDSTQTTTWKQAWGVGCNSTFRTGLLGTVVAKNEFSVHLSYNGEHGTTSSVETTAKFERRIALNAAAKKKTVVKLVVKKADDVTIPFTAKIKCTKANGTVDIFEEEGTWHGTAYHSTLVDIEELSLDSAY